MNKLQHICLCSILTGSLLLFPFLGSQAGEPGSKPVASAGVQTAGTVSQSETSAKAQIPLQEEMQYLTASQLAEEERLMAILWVQRSAEFRGLSYQAYNLATTEVDKAVAHRREIEKTLRKAGKDRNIAKQRSDTQLHEAGRITPGHKRKHVPEEEGLLLPLAVVIDIDDTLFCNAPLEVYYIEHPEAKADYNTWEQWIAQNIDLLPGARDFLKYADRHGVQIFYVTGRGPQDKKVTEKFLRKAGLPFPDASHLLLNDRSGSKMNQFAKLARHYDIICYLGDNVADFPIGAIRDENAIIYKKENDNNNSNNGSALNNAAAKNQIPFDADKDTANFSKTEMQSGKDKTEMPLDIQAMLKRDKNAKRNRIIDANKRSFGTKFILLPNPMYGDWENNLAKKYRRLPGEQQLALRKAVLKSLWKN
jgi:predicted secreted acid phosphatase